MDTRGTFTSAHELLDRLRARQEELGLSNSAMADLVGVDQGQIDDWLGPSRTKTPGLFYLMAMMDALALSGSLYVDTAKVERMERRWLAQGKRKAAAIRNENPRISQAMVKRAAPAVAAQMGRMGGEKRWKGTTKADIDAHIARMNAARTSKRLGAKSQ